VWKNLPGFDRTVKLGVKIFVCAGFALVASSCDVLFAANEIIRTDTGSAPPLDLDGLTRLTDDDFAYEHPSWSPDGTLIAVGRNRVSQTPMGPDPLEWEVVLLELDEASATLVGPDQGRAQMQPAWSPSAEELVVVSFDDQSNRLDVHSIETDSLRSLDCPTCDFPVWPVSGDRILAGGILNWTPEYLGDFGIIVLDPVSGATISEHVLGDPFLSHFSASPDGDKVFIADYACTGIWSYNLPSNELLSHIDSPDEFECDPALSRDGSKIAYTSRDAESDGAARLVVADADGSNPEVLLETGPSVLGFYQPSWAPDGTRIAFVYGKLSLTGHAYSTLYVVDVPPHLQP
jgi:Tol biopolymer transport system component